MFEEVFARLGEASQDRVPLVLRYSNRYASEGLTIYPHDRISLVRGSTWWGWWKASHAFDDHGFDLLKQFSSELGSGKWIGLWNRSLSQTYIAFCTEVIVAAEPTSTIGSPDPDLTPAYYNKDGCPAWLRLSGFRRIIGAEISRSSEEESGDLSELAALERVFRSFGDASGDATVMGVHERVIDDARVVDVQKRSTILHISDLHFGRFHAWSQEDAPIKGDVRVEDGLIFAMESHDIEPDDVGVIVLSGDHISGERTTEAQAAHFARAHQFLDHLFERTGTGPENLVIVPGNHDVMRADKLADGDEPFDPRARALSTIDEARKKEGERAYREFVETVMGRPEGITALKRFSFAGDVRCNFVTMNSTLPRDEYTWEFGFVGEYPLRVLKRLRQLGCVPSRDPKVLNFGVLHHHVISTVDEEYVPRPKSGAGPERVDPVSVTLDASSILDWAAEFELRFLLHGHQHKPKWRFVGARESTRGHPFVTEVVGAGSAGADWRPESVPLSFNVYSLDAASGMVRGRTLDLDQRLRARAASNDVVIPIRGTS